MKIHMRLFSIVFAFILFANCEKENVIDIPSEETKESPYKVRTVRLSEIPTVKDFLKTKTNLTFSKSTEIDGAIFDEENILEVTNALNNSNYTLRFSYPDTPKGTFYNLIVGKTVAGGNTKPYVLKYICDDENTDTFIANGLDFRFFKGKVLFHKYTDFFQQDSFSKGGELSCPQDTDSNGDPIPCETESVDGTIGGGLSDSSTDNNPAGNGTSTGSSNCSFDVFVKGCGASGSDEWHNIKACGGNTSIASSMGVWDCPDYKSASTKVGDGDCPPCGIPSGPIGVLADVEICQLGFIKGEDGNCVSIEETMNKLLKLDPFKLLEMDCNQIQKWQNLAQHELPQSIVDKLTNLDNNYISIISGDWNVQNIVDADGAVVNMDYFSIDVTDLPNNPKTNVEFTLEEFFNYIMDNLNDFIDQSISQFGSYNSTEQVIWDSTNPLGAIMRFDIPVPSIPILSNDGTVICSEYLSNSHWIFTTLESPKDWTHPVSGNRQFGYTENSDGSVTIFTRGVDRILNNLDLDVAEFMDLDHPFDAADALWNSFQKNIEFFTNKNGGSSRLSSKKESINRPDWEDVKDVLLGNKPISELGCIKD